MFDEMIDRIQTTTISRLLKGRIVRIQPGMPQRPVPQRPPITGMNPAIAARAREIAEQRAAEAAAKQEEEKQTAASTPSAAVTPSAAQTSGPVIGDAPQPPSDLATNIGGKAMPKVNDKNAKVGRNDPCPCGSGKKYKNCCGKL